MPICQSCGAGSPEGSTCQDDFYQCLYWEFERPDLAEVHHLMVTCYHVQHPHLLSPDGLRYMILGLRDFLSGIAPAERRQHIRDDVSSTHRTWKIRATAETHAAYSRPIRWPITIREVVTAGKDSYCESIRCWADTILATLTESTNMPT